MSRATHSWNGTRLTVTSASGTSTADLKGEKGDPGSDAAVTSTNISSALGYTPADASTVSAQGETLAQHSASITALENGKADKSEIPSVPVQDVQIDGSTILVDGVANIPKASSGYFGTVKVINSYGLNTYGDGQLGLVRSSASDIAERSANDLHAVLLGNVDKVVKAVLTDDKKIEYSAEEKASAHETLGIPAWATAESKPVYTADEVGALPSTTKIPKRTHFAISDDLFEISTDDTKGTSPYSSSYGYTNIEINKDAGIEWVEGGMYTFCVNTKVALSATRNCRVRIGGKDDGDVWHPLCEYTTSIMSGSSYFVKASTLNMTYSTKYYSYGALHAISRRRTSGPSTVKANSSSRS